MKIFKPAAICLSPGHTPQNPGATRDKTSEYSLSCEITGRAARLFSEAGHIAHLIGSDSNTKQVASINEKDCNFGLEIHFNNMASKPEWNGGLCMHSGGSAGESFASSVNHAVCESLRVRNRGIFIGNYRLDPKNRLIHMIKYTNCPFIVCEPCYLSNINDFRKIDCAAIARAIFNGCLEYWEANNAT